MTKPASLRIRFLKDKVTLVTNGNRKVAEARLLSDLDPFVQGWTGNPEASTKTLRIARDSKGALWR